MIGILPEIGAFTLKILAMQKLNIDLKYCYGIKKLTHVFDFTGSRTFVVYAPNGVMKTSFAKVFKDLSGNQDSKDLVFPVRETARKIQDENQSDLLPESIFVVEPYNEQFKSDKLSTLVVKKELKEEYEKIYKDLEIEKAEFIKKLRTTSQSTDCEDEFIATFSKREKDTFFDLLSEIFPNLEDKNPKYDFRYNDIFDKKGNVKKFLDKHKDSLQLYVENYEALISGSTFFKKSDNTFGTYQADVLLKSIEDGSFFNAGHSLKLNDNTKITSPEIFGEIVENEIRKVVEDEQLKKVFDKIDKAIGGNTELRAFKNVIEKNNLLLVELQDYDSFKKKVWASYLSQLKEDVSLLVSSYEKQKGRLQEIIAEALKSKTDWERAVGIFNERFNTLPFKLEIKNKEDVILKIEEPTIEFIFHDLGEEQRIKRIDLLQVLSQGERRALYILNIIFEVEARKKTNQETLFIMDDIADSFDYKNKYAIIEYLKDISAEDYFYQIILTHNFDFFRSVSGRIVGNGGYDRKFKLNVVKSYAEVKLIEEKYQNNPFKHWKAHLDDKSMLIASIPFVRNLAEYSGYDDEFQKLTSLLHIKSDTDSLNVEDLEDIFKAILKDKNDLDLNDKTKKVIDVIFEIADEILGGTDEIMELENKIVLSIAIRLKAEQFMVQKINDQPFLDQIGTNQTIMLIKKYKELFETETENIEMLEQVNLMTPENIHLNSFMYEPILDMSDRHLKNLYGKVSNLL